MDRLSVRVKVELTVRVKGKGKGRLQSVGFRSSSRFWAVSLQVM